MRYDYIIPLETPSKKNSRINTRSGRSYPSKRYQVWHKSAVKSLMAQDRPLEPIDSPVSVSGAFVRGDNRLRDNNNSGASILDLLVDVGILSDDNYNVVKCECWEHKGVDKGNPCAWVTITTI